MRLFSKNSKVVKGSIFDDVPTPKPNELLAIPVSNTLWHPSVGVYKSREKQPDWYKEATGGVSGLKRCYGLGDYMKVGYIVPLWAKLDIRLPVSKFDEGWDARYDIINSSTYELEMLDEKKLHEYFSGEALRGNQFPAAQAGSCPVASVKSRKNSSYLKLTNPWLFKTAPGYSTLFIHPQWEPNGNYHVMSGVVNTDYYHHCNVVMNITTSSEFSVKEGTPMLHAIPFKRSDAIKNSELIKGDEAMHKILDGLGFNNVHRSTNWEGGYKHEQSKIDKKLGQDNG